MVRESLPSYSSSTSLGNKSGESIEEWLDEREWVAEDITSKLTSEPTVDFAVSLVADTGETGRNVGSSIRPVQAALHVRANRNAGRNAGGGERSCPHDVISPATASGRALELNARIAFSYQGSILSQLEDEWLPKSLLGFKNYFKTVKSLDLLSPQTLRKRTREIGGGLGLGGQRLASFLDEIGACETAGTRSHLAESIPSA